MNRILKMMIPEVWQIKLDLRRCRAEEKKARAEAPPENQRTLDSGEFLVYLDGLSELHQWHRSLITDYYRNRTNAYSVPLPDPDDEKLWVYVENYVTRSKIKCLSTAGEHAAIAIIRECQKHHREVKAFWLTWVTGLGGILIGVISVWPKK